MFSRVLILGLILLFSHSAFAKTVKLSPTIRAISGLEGKEIKSKDLLNYIKPVQIIDPRDYAQLPMIAAFEEDLLLADTGDDILVAGLDPNIYEYDVLEAGQQVIDPDTNDSFGVLAYGIARANVVQKGSKFTKLRILSSSSPVYRKYKVRAAIDLNLPTKLRAYRPDFPLVGKVVSLPNAMHMEGLYQQVVVNIGNQQGLSTGMLLRVYPKRSSDILLDEEKKVSGNWQSGGYENESLSKEIKELEMVNSSGELLIYQTHKNYSFGLIVSSEVPIKLYDLVKAD